MGSLWHTLTSTLAISCLRRISFMVSFCPFVTMLAHLFIILVTVQSHLQTGKCPTNFPQVEKTARHVSVTGSPELSFYCNVLCSLQTSSPTSRVPSFNHVGLLLVTEDSSFFLTSSAGIMSSFTHISFTFAHIAFIIISSSSKTILIMAFIIRGMILKPNLRHVKQHLLPLMMTVWNGHSN